MKNNNFFQKRTIHIYILIFIIAIVVITAGLVMIKYYTEGEKNLPFKVTKISTLCTAESKLYKNEELWNADIMQKSNVFFTIQKNDKYKKEDGISKIIFTNFVIEKTTDKGESNVYRPSKMNNEYTYLDEYIVVDNLEYTGAQTTNSELLQINNQGGIIGFSIATKNLGTCQVLENEKLASDGTLLKKVGLNLEDIQFTITFDLIIETESGNKFKSNIKLDLPTENILETGVSKKEDTELKNIIFKRF